MSHETRWLPVAYQIEIVAPPLDDPTADWQLHLVRGKYCNGSAYNMSQISQCSFTMTPSKEDLDAWIIPLFPIDMTTANELVRETLHKLGDGSWHADEHRAYWNGYRLSFYASDVIGLRPYWAFNCRRQTDCHFFDHIKGKEELSFKDKPTRSCLEGHLKRYWLFDQETITGMLDALLVVCPDAFSPEPIQEPQTLPTKQRRLPKSTIKLLTHRV